MRMKALVVVLFFVTATTIGRATEPLSQSATLRVMSFNDCNSGENDGENAWPKRKDLFFKVIEQFNPDLLGMQEVLADQRADVAERMKGYGLAGVGRNDGKTNGEFALVVYRKDRFDLLDSGNFWLSETPDVAGSKSWDAALTRICSWVVLSDKLCGRKFIYANTHFDHRGTVARKNAAILLMTKLPELSKGNPVILTGDFNTTEDDEPYKTILQPTSGDMAHLTDCYREVHPKREPDERSAHHFDDADTKGSRIDFIFHTPELKADDATIDRTKSDDGHFPSDHYAVTATLRWNP